MIVALVVAAAMQAPQGPYSDSATAALIARARERHRQLSAAVQNYEATVRTRIDANVARGRFSRLIPLVASEQVARLTWQSPNDLRLVTVGSRTRVAFRGARADARFDRPWFVPRFLGDSIRLLDNDIPERAAVHPLGAGAEPFYNYAIEDSLQLVLPGRTVRAVSVRVTPTRADGAFVAGDLWLDPETAETVRFRFTFVGRQLWGRPRGETRRDSARAQRDNDRAAQVLRVSADLEYGLFLERYWLPYRQVLVLDIELPWVGNVAIPVTFLTTFSDVRVNAAAPIAFTVPLPPAVLTAEQKERRQSRKLADRPTGPGVPGRNSAERRRELRAEADSLHREWRAQEERERREGYSRAGSWQGGRFEIVVSSDSALRGYAGWTDSLEWAATSDDAVRLEDLRRDALAAVSSLPRDLYPRPGLLVAVDRFADAWRYNRAEGTAVGAGLRLPVRGPYLSLGVRARYAFGDRRLQATASLRRDVIGSRLELAAFREMVDADPLSPGLNPGNSFRAAFLAHDDGAYVFAQGVELRRQFTYRRVADVSLGLSFAQERAPMHLAHSGLNDFLGGSGDFAPLDPVLPGTFTTLSAGVAGGLLQTSWRVAAEATTGAGAAAGRLWATAETAIRAPAGVSVALRGRLGVGAGDGIPQRAFRLGGSRTLRGCEAGEVRGASVYAASADASLAGRLVSPVVFVDVGQVAERRLSFAGGLRTSVGAGVSALWGLLRVHAARSLESGARWRLDIVFGSLL